MIAAMLNPAYLKGETWGFPGEPVEEVETHAAHVLLVDGLAFKIKKDVKLPYLDFSSVEKRRAVLADELAINKAFAPAIYREVKDVLGEPALVMNRFPANAALSWKVAHGGIDHQLAARLAETAAEAHIIAPARDTPGFDIMSGLAAQLSDAFVSSPDIFNAAQTLEFHAHYYAALKQHRGLLNARAANGLVRRCHGDMHCDNIIVIDGKPVLFDAIEFSEKIATIDVLYDLAFLLMDLWRYGERAAANTVLNHYLDLRREQEDLSGLALLPLLQSTRAGVRALVTADLMHEQGAGGNARQRGTALDYFRSSIGYLKPARPSLICIGGLSGTGKSTLARELAPDIGAAPGALHVRSDVERKIMAGVAMTEKLPPESYSRAASMQVYHVMLLRAEKALRAGHSVVLDAVFAREGERHAAETMAKRLRVPLHGFWLQAETDVLKQRVKERSGDPSDADAAVVDAQLGYDVGHMHWIPVDASGSSGDSRIQVKRHLGI